MTLILSCVTDPTTASVKTQAHRPAQMEPPQPALTVKPYHSFGSYMYKEPRDNLINMSRKRPNSKTSLSKHHWCGASQSVKVKHAFLQCCHVIIVSGGTAYQGTIGYMLLAEKLALPTKCDSDWNRRCDAFCLTRCYLRTAQRTRSKDTSQRASQVTYDYGILAFARLPKLSVLLFRRALILNVH